MNKYKEFALVAFVSFVLLLILNINLSRLTPDHPDYYEPWDHHSYRWMAENDPLDLHIAPFGWRVGKPFLASVLPFKIQTNFIIITLISLWITGIALYYFIKSFNFAAPYTIIGIGLFFSMDFVVRTNLANFWLADSAAFPFLLFSILSLSTNREIWFIVLVAIGVLFKESMIFVAPLYYTFHNKRLVDLKPFAKTIIFALPGVIVLISLRILIPKIDDPKYFDTIFKGYADSWLTTLPYNYLTLPEQILQIRSKVPLLSFPFAYVLFPFGVSFLLSLASPRKNIMVIYKFLPFLLLVYSQIIFAVNTERLLALAFPVTVIMTLNGIKAISERFSMSPSGFALLPFALIGASLLHSDIYRSTKIPTALLLSFLLVVFISRRIQNQIHWRKQQFP